MIAFALAAVAYLPLLWLDYADGTRPGCRVRIGEA